MMPTAKMLKKMSEKLGAKFPVTTPGCSKVKIARLDDAFLEVFLTASKPSRRSITAAKRKEKEKKARRASCGAINAFLTRLKLIWPRSSLNTTKMPQKRIFSKKLQESMR